MSWVSVKERLPDEGTWAMWLESRIAAGMFVGKRTGRQVEDTCGDSFTTSVDSLTHWAPLPEVPAARAAGTVRIRVAVVVDKDGKWSAHGWGGREGLGEDEDEIIGTAYDMNGGDVDAVHWVGADVPVPIGGEEIRGEVQG